MVSEPRHRITKTNGQPLLPARQYPDELVHSIDVFRTVLDYAGIPLSSGDGDPIAPASVHTGRADYRFGRSLKAYVSDATPPTGHIRDVVYGEHADQGGGYKDHVQRGATRNRYLVTRPGLVGVCMSGGNPVQTGSITYDPEHSHSSSHARPCFLGGSADCPSGTCEAVNRCINDPSKTCTDNGDCIEASTFCSSPTSGKCLYNWRGSLGDNARPVEPASVNDDAPSRACSYDTGDQVDDRDEVAATCVPTDVQLCQPLILKVRSKFDPTDPNAGHIEAAWDISWDPDERHNLLEDPDYLGSVSSPSSWSLRSQFDICLDNYWSVSSTTSEWNGNPSGCAWAEPALP
jgi:hypothetical protein